jgi:tRNA U38,U39,U40 pseudouridine synthase TruA
MNITHDNDNRFMKKDSIVQDVIEQFNKRSETGIRKYGVTLEREDLSTYDWLNHLQEELQDATLYIQRLKKELSTHLGVDDLDHWCAYNGISGENRKELDRIITMIIHERNV